MIKVLIVDDDAAFRQSVGALLREQLPRIEVREASNGREALAQLERLDVLFMDISLPQENGLDLAGRIKSEHPGLTVAILTMHDAPEYQAAALQQGADYFLSKGAPAEKILEVAQSVSHMHPKHRQF